MAPLALPIVKLIGLAAKQIAKPVSTALVGRAKKEPEGFIRWQCIKVGQLMNYARVMILRRSDGRSNQERTVAKTISYYVESADDAIEEKARGQSDPTPSSDEPSANSSAISATPFLEPAGKLTRGQLVEIVRPGTLAGMPDNCGPSYLIEWRSKSSKDKRGWITQRFEDGSDTLRPISVKPLPEDEALEAGSVLVAETMIFGVAAGVAIWEWRRSVESSERAAEKKKRRHDEKEAQRASDYARRDAHLQALEASSERRDAHLQALEASSQQLQSDLQKVQSSLQHFQRLLLLCSAGGAVFGAALLGTIRR